MTVKVADQKIAHWYRFLLDINKRITNGHLDPDDAISALRPLIGLKVKFPFHKGKESPINSNELHVEVDRSISDNYAQKARVERLLRPKLELAGPRMYNLQSLGVFRPEDQIFKDEYKPFSVYTHLQTTNALQYCLSYQDGLAIKEKGVSVFRQIFAGRKLFLWKSVEKSSLGNPSVPFLSEWGDGLDIHYHDLHSSYGWDIMVDQSYITPFFWGKEDSDYVKW